VSYLFDTNVVSETRKRRPPPQIVAVLNAIPLSAAHISVLTLGEMRRGAVMKAASDPGSAAEFELWLADIETTLVGRILPITPGIASRWGEMSAGRTRPVIDTLLAATASVHGLTVVTRNTRDFRDLGVSVLNPWDA
jgi:predicted nucleic acid-binding protein